MNTLHLPHSHAEHGHHHARRDELRHRRRNRWLAIGSILVAGLLFYVAGLNWFANRLAADISDSIQPAPALEDSMHRAD
jgi:hypothetical protein